MLLSTPSSIATFAISNHCNQFWARWIHSELSREIGCYSQIPKFQFCMQLLCRRPYMLHALYISFSLIRLPCSTVQQFNCTLSGVPDGQYGRAKYSNRRGDRYCSSVINLISAAANSMAGLSTATGGEGRADRYCSSVINLISAAANTANRGSYEIRNVSVPAWIIQQFHTDVVKVTCCKRENRAGVNWQSNRELV
jgi:hypothetical protein